MSDYIHTHPYVCVCVCERVCVAAAPHRFHDHGGVIMLPRLYLTARWLGHAYVSMPKLLCLHRCAVCSHIIGHLETMHD